MFLEFSLEREVETPTMQFGGRQGKTVTFLILKRNDWFKGNKYFHWKENLYAIYKVI